MAAVRDKGTVPTLEVLDLSAVYEAGQHVVHVLNDVTLNIRSGEILALVGESGSGKSATALAIMTLLSRASGRIVSGEIRFKGQNMLEMSEYQRRALRGSELSLVFQNPMTTLNPTRTIGAQMREVIHCHQSISEKAIQSRSVELLKMLQIPDPVARLKSYPHQLSGGLRQRVMIALALSCDPSLLIADEATTAIDATTQKQILALLRHISSETGTAMLAITHNMGVVANLADRVAVMYAGRIVETGDVSEVFHDPRHPYTYGLLSSIPRIDTSDSNDLHVIEGSPPSLAEPVSGCPYADRCWLVMDRCRSVEPAQSSFNGHAVACWADVESVRQGPPCDSSDQAPADGTRLVNSM